MYHEITAEVQERIDIIKRDYDQAAMATTGERFPLITKIAPVVVEGEIYLLLSDLSNHTQNIKNISKRVSLYFVVDETHASRLNNPRYTVMGKLYPVPYNDDKAGEVYQNMLDHFDRKDRGAKMYGMFGDFNIYRFEQHDHFYNEGFGKAYK